MATGVYPRWTPECRSRRFWSRVDKSGDCWLWTGAVRSFGYGNFKSSRTKQVAAHRFAYETTKGPIPPGLIVRHRCDNPRCVNPDHLELGTHADNMRDMAERGRGRSKYSNATHCIHGHEFTVDNTYIHPKRGSRHCKACQRARGKGRAA